MMFLTNFFGSKYDGFKINKFQHLSIRLRGGGGCNRMCEQNLGVLVQKGRDCI